MTTLTGPQRAALVLAQLDTERATRVLRAMSEQEVVSLMAAMTTLPSLAKDEVSGVLAEFNAQAVALTEVGQGGTEVARRLLAERLGDARAEEILEQFAAAYHPHPLAFLRQVEVDRIAGFLSGEHPQTVAVVLAHLPADAGARLLAGLDEQTRADITRRVATMGRISPRVIEELAEVLEQRLAALVRSGPSVSDAVGGVSSVVNLLNQSDRGMEKQILASLEETDPEIAERIRQQLFVFDDVVGLDERTLQLVLRRVVPKDLAVALRGTSEEVRAKFMGALSSRAAADLAEEIELLGPTRSSQVEAAQSAIVRTVRELEAAGEIQLSRGDDELV